MTKSHLASAVAAFLFTVTTPSGVVAAASLPVVPPEPDRSSAGSNQASADTAPAASATDRGAEVLNLRMQIRTRREEIEAGRSADLEQVDGAYRDGLAAIDPKDMFETDAEYHARNAREKSEAALEKASTESTFNRKYDALLSSEVEPLFQRVRTLLDGTDVVSPDVIAVHLEKYDPELGVFTGGLEIDSDLIETKARVIVPMKREDARTFWKNEQSLVGRVTFSMDVYSLEIDIKEFWLEDPVSAHRTKERIAVIETRALSDEQRARANGLKMSATALLNRSAQGVNDNAMHPNYGSHTAEAKGWVTEYNRLVLEAKSVFSNDPHIQALKALSHGGSNSQAAGAVTAAARAMVAYLKSFVSSDAFEVSANLLANRSAQGSNDNAMHPNYGSHTAEAKGWVTEYNRLVLEAKSVFSNDPHIQALKALSHGGSNSQAAGAVTTAAKALGRAMENVEGTSREIAAEAVVDAESPSPGYTLLEHLPYSGRFSPDALKLAGLLGRWFSPDAKDENGWMDLHYAAALNLPGLASALLEAGADPGARLKGDGEDFTGDLKGTLSTFKRELDGEDLGDWARSGQTPIHFAAWFNAESAAPHLVVGGSKVDSQSRAGRTPLYLAAWKDSRMVAEFLIGQSANVNAGSRNDGWTPLDYAIYRKAPGTASLLRRHGANCAKNCQ